MSTIELMQQVTDQCCYMKFQGPCSDELMELHRRFSFLNTSEIIVFAICGSYGQITHNMGYLAYVWHSDILTHLGFQKTETAQIKAHISSLEDFHLIESARVDSTGNTIYVIPEDIWLRLERDTPMEYTFGDSLVPISNLDIENMIRHGHRGYAVLSFRYHYMTKKAIYRELGGICNFTLLYDEKGGISKAIMYIETFYFGHEVWLHNLRYYVPRVAKKLNATYSILSTPPSSEELWEQMKGKFLRQSPDVVSRFLSRFRGEIIWH